MEIIQAMFFGMMFIFTFIMLIVAYMFVTLNKTIIKIEKIRKCDDYADVQKMERSELAEKQEPKDKLTRSLEKIIKNDPLPEGESDWVEGVQPEHNFKN